MWNHHPNVHPGSPDATRVVPEPIDPSLAQTGTAAEPARLSSPELPLELAELLACFGPGETLALIDEFLQSAGETYQHLMVAFDQDDRKALACAAHSLRGGCGAVGLEVLMQKLAELEYGCSAAPIEKFTTWRAAIEVEYRHGVEFLSAIQIPARDCPIRLGE